MTAAVMLDDATKDFGGGVGALGLDLEVLAGSIVGLIGPSGSGKTTAVRLMTGVLKPDRGTVRVFGDDPTAFGPDQRRRIGYLPQESVLYPRLSIAENIRFIAAVYDAPRRAIDPVLDLVQLGEHRRRKLEDASGGMKRRLGLAAALLADPPLLFLDEPTAGIDPVLRTEFWDHFRALRDDGKTLVVTTQYVGEAAFCDQVAVVIDGRIAMVDTPTGLRRRAFGGTPVDLHLAGVPPAELRSRLEQTPGVSSVEADGLTHLVVTVEGDPGPVIADLAEVAAELGLEVESLSERPVSFDEVFTRIVTAENEVAA